MSKDFLKKLAAKVSEEIMKSTSSVEKLGKKEEDILLRMQLPKMKELWDNEEDEAWENA